MLVGVAVKAAEEAAASALESCEADFLSALVASVLLGFLAVFVAFFGRRFGNDDAVFSASTRLRNTA